MAPLRRAPAALAAVVLCSMWQAAPAAESAVSSALGMIREAYTTNAICGKKNCINPVFPGMEDLHRLEANKWISSSLQKTAPSMGFCRNAVTYDPALPIPMNGGSAELKALVQRQDNAASTMFFYHLTGLGLEAWDYQQPEFANDCIKSIWRMVCYTYFPRAEIGKQDGSLSKYMRPCQSSCQNYVRACGVECCDESVSCVFEHTKAISKSQTVTTQGYIAHDGPSSMCTGVARRSSPLGIYFWALLAVLMALSLQGCDYDVPEHKVGNWRGQPDYLLKHEFVAPGGSVKSASLNSCSVQHLSQTLQCSGRGVCKMWDPGNAGNALSFCECDTEWADPECRTKRKSQLTAYFLALFLGFLGADQFYLGIMGKGLVKLFTCGGFGVLWIMDIVKIGSAPVYSDRYRAAADLPHYAFVLTATMFAVFVGFVVAFIVTKNFRFAKRKEAMLLQMDEEARQRDAMNGQKPFGDAYSTGMKKPMMQSGPGDFGPMNAGPYGTMPPMMPGTGLIM